MRRTLFPILVVVAACGGDDSRVRDSGGGPDARADGGADAAPDSSTPLGPISETDYPSVLARAWCETRFACDCEATQPDVETCVRVTAEGLERQGTLFRDTWA